MNRDGPLPGSGVDPEARARALQSLLVERDLLSTDLVDSVVSIYEEDIGPMNGARVVARAWTDDEYRERLLADSTAVLEDHGYTGLDGVEIIVVPNTEEVHNVMVCTLCSCFPWPVLGLPPTWYKQPGYRSQMVKRPRRTLREDFGLAIDEAVEIRVRDTSAEVRYMVLPRRPAGTHGWTESELADLVTREMMIGVARPGDRHVEEIREGA
jgi:nitrile hydratase